MRAIGCHGRSIPQNKKNGEFCFVTGLDNTIPYIR